jgi:uncharacterized membrane protein
MSLSPARTPAPRPAPQAVRSVGIEGPISWLSRGWHDLRRCPLPGLIHGAASAAFGALLFLLARDQFWWLAGAFSGFLLVAPVVATGLYAISRALQAGEQPGLGTALAAWRPRDGRLVGFGLLLALAGTGWVLTSAALITVMAPAPIEKPLDFIRSVMMAPALGLFEVWLLLGAVLAAPVFASTVLALPVLLDTRAGVRQAVLLSWRAVLANPLTMALWAGLLLLLTLVAMASALLGLIVVVPWLAHASWHAYRDLVAQA